MPAMRTVSMKLPGELVGKIDSKAMGLGIGRSELIRRALRLYLEGDNGYVRRSEMKEYVREMLAGSGKDVL